jgi:hypothetical protein
MSEGRVLKSSLRSWVGGSRDASAAEREDFGNEVCLNLGRAEARPYIKSEVGAIGANYCAAAAEVATPSSFSFARARRSSSVPG